MPTLFNWDAEEVLALLPGDLVKKAIDLATEEQCEDMLTLYHHHAMIIHSPDLICPMCSLLFSVAGGDGRGEEGRAGEGRRAEGRGGEWGGRGGEGADGTGQRPPRQGAVQAGAAGHVLALLLPTPPSFYQLLGQVLSTTMQPTQEFAAQAIIVSYVNNCFLCKSDECSLTQEFAARAHILKSTIYSLFFVLSLVFFFQQQKTLCCGEKNVLWR